MTLIDSRQRRAGLSIILLEPPNQPMVDFFNQVSLLGHQSAYVSAYMDTFTLTSYVVIETQMAGLIGEATTPWFPIKTDEVHLAGLRMSANEPSHAPAAAQPSAPQPQGKAGCLMYLGTIIILTRPRSIRKSPPCQSFSCLPYHDTPRR